MRRAITLPFALIAVLTVGATVLAGGWATVAASRSDRGSGSRVPRRPWIWRCFSTAMTAVSWPRLTVNCHQRRDR